MGSNTDLRTEGTREGETWFGGGAERSKGDVLEDIRLQDFLVGDGRKIAGDRVFTCACDLVLRFGSYNDSVTGDGFGLPRLLVWKIQGNPQLGQDRDIVLRGEVNAIRTDVKTLHASRGLSAHPDLHSQASGNSY